MSTVHPGGGLGQAVGRLACGAGTGARRELCPQAPPVLQPQRALATQPVPPPPAKWLPGIARSAAPPSETAAWHCPQRHRKLATSSVNATTATERDYVRATVPEQAPNRRDSVALPFGCTALDHESCASITSLCLKRADETGRPGTTGLIRVRVRSDLLRRNAVQLHGATDIAMICIHSIVLTAPP